jgi:micrococcal nuclease
MPAALAALVLCVTPAVHDGDSIRCGGAERVRISNIDAPEMPGSPKCQARRAARAWCDYRAAEQARRALVSLTSRGPVMIKRQGTDQYGRTLARVTVNGIDAGEWLVRAGLARRWE